jgi:hypothetical protein
MSKELSNPQSGLETFTESPTNLQDLSKFGLDPEGSKNKWEWVRALPPNTVIAGKHQSGADLAVCRADMGNGIHSGTVWRGQCYVGWGGKNVPKQNFDFLVADPGAVAWVDAKPGQPLPTGAVERVSGFGSIHFKRVAIFFCVSADWGSTELGRVLSMISFNSTGVCGGPSKAGVTRPHMKVGDVVD